MPNLPSRLKKSRPSSPKFLPDSSLVTVDMLKRLGFTEIQTGLSQRLDYYHPKIPHVYINSVDLREMTMLKLFNLCISEIWDQGVDAGRKSIQDPATPPNPFHTPEEGK